MDTVMNLTVYGENAAAALESAEKELHTLDEAVLSRTAEGSELYALNASNGETVTYGADDILPALIETALTISDATDGAFDPTLAPCSTPGALRRTLAVCRPRTSSQSC